MRLLSVPREQKRAPGRARTNRLVRVRERGAQVCCVGIAGRRGKGIRGKEEELSRMRQGLCTMYVVYMQLRSRIRREGGGATGSANTPQSRQVGTTGQAGRSPDAL